MQRRWLTLKPQGDNAAFAKPDIYEYLEERHVLYAIRLPGNEVLQREIAPLLRRPVGRPPKRPVILFDMNYQCLSARLLTAAGCQEKQKANGDHYCT